MDFVQTRAVKVGPAAGRSDLYCPNCGANYADDATRCINCGNTLQKIETPSVDVPPPGVSGAGFAPTGASGGAVPYLPNYLVQSILLTIACFFLSFFAFFFPILGVIPGIVAIVYGSQVNGKVAGANYTGARESSRLAKIWCWVTFAVVVLEIIIIVIFILLFVVALVASAGSS